MPPRVDMSLVREALQRRLSGAMGGQGGTPSAMMQRTNPGGALPTGGANTPMQSIPMTPTPDPSSVPNIVPGSAGAAGANAGQMAQSPQFDEETRGLAKQLVAKLLKGL